MKQRKKVSTHRIDSIASCEMKIHGLIKDVLGNRKRRRDEQKRVNTSISSLIQNVGDLEKLIQLDLLLLEQLEKLQEWEETKREREEERVLPEKNQEQWLIRHLIASNKNYETLRIAWDLVSSGKINEFINGTT